MTLKKEKKEETDVVHQYLDNIRNLSSQKEQLANELQDENKLLRSEAAQVRSENEALLAQIQLVTELTSDESLQQQLTGKNIPERIEFFLEERSLYISRIENLQSELQSMKNSNSTLQQQVSKMQASIDKEKERKQSIIQKSKEAEQNSAKLLEDLKSQEKEKSEVLQKYFKMNAQMAESKQKIAKLQEEIKRTRENSITTEQHQKELQKAKDEAQGQVMSH